MVIQKDHLVMELNQMAGLRGSSLSDKIDVTRHIAEMNNIVTKNNVTNKYF